MLAKILVIVILLAITFNLFRGLFFLVKDKDHEKRTVNALSWRIGLSILLFVLLLVLNYFGVIELHSLPQVKPE